METQRIVRAKQRRRVAPSTNQALLTSLTFIVVKMKAGFQRGRKKKLIKFLKYSKKLIYLSTILFFFSLSSQISILGTHAAVYEDVADQEIKFLLRELVLHAGPDVILEEVELGEELIAVATLEFDFLLLLRLFLVLDGLDVEELLDIDGIVPLLFFLRELPFRVPALILVVLVAILVFLLVLALVVQSSPLGSPISDPARGVLGISLAFARPDVLLLLLQDRLLLVPRLPLELEGKLPLHIVDQLYLVVPLRLLHSVGPPGIVIHSAKCVDRNQMQVDGRIVEEREEAPDNVKLGAYQKGYERERK